MTGQRILANMKNAGVTPAWLSLTRESPLEVVKTPPGPFGYVGRTLDVPVVLLDDLRVGDSAAAGFLTARRRHPAEGRRAVVLLKPLPELCPVGEFKQRKGVHSVGD